MDIEQQLEFWGYTEKWLDYGVITEEQLVADLEMFQKNPYEYNKEYYRSGHLYRYLDALESITDLQIEQVLELSWEDEDSGFVDLYLLKHQILNDEQFKKLAIALFEEESVSKQLIRTLSLRRRFRKEGAIQSVIDDALSRKDTRIQQELLEQYQLSTNTLKQFIEQGSSKAVRGFARYQLDQLKGKFRRK